MGLLKSEDSSKWINALLAITCIVFAFVMIRFVGQMAEWFDLEAKISNFVLVSQGLGVASGIVAFVFAKTNSKTSLFLDEVYGQLLKVIWPDKDSVFKLTIGIIIGLVIASLVFLAVDYSFGALLKLIY